MIPMVYPFFVLSVILGRIGRSAVGSILAQRKGKVA